MLQSHLPNDRLIPFDGFFQLAVLALNLERLHLAQNRLAFAQLLADLSQLCREVGIRLVRRVHQLLQLAYAF